jgi:streptogramin lyase
MFTNQPHNNRPGQGHAIDISAGADGSIWVIGYGEPSDGRIYRWDNATSNWSPIDGGGRRIAVGPDGLPWVVNTAGEIYRRHKDGTWQRFPGLARDISVGAEGSVWIIGTNKIGNDYRIFRWNEAISNWEVADGMGTRIAVGPDGRPWVMNSAGQVFHF